MTTKLSVLEKFRAYQDPLLGKFGQDVLWNVGSLAIMGVCGVVLNLTIAWAYNPDTLGVFNQVYAIYIIVSQFAVAGIHLSVLKHVAQYSTNARIYRAINTAALILSLIFAGVVSLLLWLWRDLIGSLLFSPGVAFGIGCAAPGLFFFSINKVFLSILNGLARMKWYAVFQAVRYILMIVALLVVAVLNAPGAYLALVFVIAEVGLFIGMLPVILPELSRPAAGVLRQWMATHLDFGVRGFLSNVLLEMNTRVDILVLGFFTDDRTVGIYSFAAMIAEGVYQLPLVLRLNYNPLLVQLIARQDWSAFKALVDKGVRFAYAMMLPIGIVAVLLYPVGLGLLTNKSDFMQSWPIFATLMAGIALSSGYIPFGNLLLQAGRPGWHTVMVSLLVLLNVVGNILLVPWFGAIGSAAATAVSFLLSAVLLHVFSRSVLSVRV